MADTEDKAPKEEPKRGTGERLTPRYTIERFMAEAAAFGMEPYIIQGAASYNGWDDPEREFTQHEVEAGVKKWLASPVTDHEEE